MEERERSEQIGQLSMPGEDERYIEALFEKDRFSQVGKLIRGLIHNINGPLQNISMLVEMFIRGQDQLDHLVHKHSHDEEHDPSREFLKEWESLFGKQQQRSQRMIHQISAMTEILRDLMTVMEMERNEPEVDLNLALNKLVRVFQSDLFFKHHVELELRLTESLPIVRIPGRNLIPALIHLFQNALTAMKESPRKKLIIECRKDLEVGCIRILFQDSGCGTGTCDGEDVLFDIFYSNWPQSIAKHEQEEKHFGFGLYAVRRLLEPYGVRIRLVRDGEETKAMLEIPIPL